MIGMARGIGFVLALSAGSLLAPVAPAAAQEDDPAERLSPIGLVRTHIGEAYVKVTYGRPYIRDRQIFGAAGAADGDGPRPLVPYGRLWRTGANEATEITMTAPLTIAGRRLEAGTYSIFTVPGPSTWTVRFNPALGLDGTGRLDPVTRSFTPNVYDAERDALVIDVPAATLDRTVDPMAFVFEPTAAGADLVLRWERTEVRIPMAAAGR